jgi:hypothetical protein
MPEYSNKNTRRLPRGKPISNKEIKEVKQEETSNFEKVLDWFSRPSRGVAGAADALVDGENPLTRFIDNIQGEKKDQWSKNISEWTGADESSFPVRAAGFVGDAVIDPLNLVPGLGLGKLVNPARKAVQGVQASAKAGKYGNFAQSAANTAKSARGLVSNFAGLTPEEKALAQLFDAKRHSLDDLAKEEAIKVLKQMDEQFAKTGDATVLTRGRNEAIQKGKETFEQMLQRAQTELQDGVTKKFGSNLTPDFERAVGTRMGTAKKGQQSWDESFSHFAAQAGASKLAAPDRAFKLSATRWNPMFYQNNFIGNVLQTAQEASKDKPLGGFVDTAKGFAGEYLGGGVKAGGKKFTRDQLEQLGRTRGVKTNVSSIYKGKETGGSIDQTLDALVKTHMDSVSGKPLNKMAAKGTEFWDWAQQGVEGKGRQAAFNTYFKQAVEKGLDEGAAADEAALRVAQSLFDYEDISPLMRGVRAMPVVGQPFVTWGLKNTPRQAEFLAKNSSFINKIAAAERVGENPEYDEAPDYMREKGSFQIGKFGDKNVFLNPALPQADINRLPFSLSSGKADVTPFFSGTHPLGKYIAEVVGNRDFFRDMPLAPDYVDPGDRLTYPQTIQPHQRWLLEQAPDLFGAMGAVRAPSTGNPQAPFWMKKAMEYSPVANNILRGAHAIAEPDKASDKTPLGLGSLLPVDVKTDKQLKVSKEFEKKDLSDKVRAKRKAAENKKNRLTSRENQKQRFKRLRK